MPGLHWQIGGVFVIVFLTALFGFFVWLYCRITIPDYFKGRTLAQFHPHPGPRRVGLAS